MKQKGNNSSNYNNDEGDLSSSSSSSHDDRRKKIITYEKLVNEQLRPQLKEVIEARDKLNTELAKYLQLRSNIKLIKRNDQQQVQTLLNLGSDFYVQAEM